MLRLLYILLAAAILCGACSTQRVERKDVVTFPADALRDSLTAVVSRCPGEIGVALITDSGDTLTVGNVDKYPLMSVFKLHQAIALCRHLGETGGSIDSIVAIPHASLNPDTWSPMLADVAGDTLTMPVSRLVRYAVMQSDNNASNYMFENLLDVAATDSIIASVVGRDGFSLKYDEADMLTDHARAYQNHSSPLAVARLLRTLMLDSIVTPAHKQMICSALADCKTGTDRIVAPLAAEKGVRVWHKTGSGFRNNGILAAHNDAAYVTLPDGRSYTLVVLVKDTPASEADAAKVIAEISATVRRAFGSGGVHAAERERR